MSEERERKSDKNEKPLINKEALIFMLFALFFLAVFFISAGGYLYFNHSVSQPVVVSEVSVSHAVKPAPVDMIAIPETVAQMPIEIKSKAPPVQKEIVPAVEKPIAERGPDPLGLVLDNLAGTLSLTSAAFEAGRRLPLHYTCHWSHITPPLRWQGAPEGTKSYVLFLENRTAPEAPFLTWLLFNISVEEQSLPEKMPKTGPLENGALYAVSDYGKAEYIGPCHSRGTYPYVFSLFALDTVLALEEGVSRDDLIAAMNGHIIDRAELPVKHYYRM